MADLFHHHMACVWTDPRAGGPPPAHLQSALQGPQRVYLLVDDGVLVASDERLSEVVMRKRLLVAYQRNPSFLYAVQHRAHLVFRASL